MQLTRPVRNDDAGSVMVIALMTALITLALGLALLSIVDTQASQSGVERTRDRAFNLSESVLTSEAFVLGHNWPASSGGGTLVSPVERNCGDAAAVVAGGSLGTTATAGTATALLQPNLNATYTDAAYTGASWQVSVCDDDPASATPTVWSDAKLSDGSTKNWDKNGNGLLWVRAQSTVAGKTRAVAGLVKVLTEPALNAKYGLVAGNVGEDLSTAAAAITNATVLAGLTSGLITTNPPVAADAAYPLPASGVTGLRCGLLNSVNLQKTCVTGTIGALGAVPLVNTLVTNGAYTQYPGNASTDPATAGQLRAQAKASGTYTATSAGASTAAAAPPCTITGTPSANTVVFIEAVGTGDQYCVIDVSSQSRSYRALVIASGRVVVRGDDTAAAYSAAATTDLFTGVVYALNAQSSDLSSTSPTRELVRLESGARVRGAVHADGKNATVSMVPPDFNTTALVNGLLCPGALCSLAPLLNGLVGTLGLSGTVNALINGTCLVSLPILGCTVSLPGLGATAVLGTATTGLLGQMSTYGSAIHSDVSIVNALKVYGASGVIPGTFTDLQPHR